MEMGERASPFEISNRARAASKVEQREQGPLGSLNAPAAFPAASTRPDLAACSLTHSSPLRLARADACLPLVSRSLSLLDASVDGWGELTG